MQFAQPYFLYLLILIPIFGWGFIFFEQYRKEMLSKLADAHLFDDLVLGGKEEKYLFKNIFLMLFFLFLILALARPQWGFSSQEIKKEGVDIFLLLDTSKSMLAEDIKPNRFERSKMAINDFLKQLKGDRIGLITFEGDAFLTCPLTADKEGFRLALNSVYVGMMPTPGTNLDLALQEAMRGYEEIPSKYKVVIVVTDGENWDGDPIAWAKIAKDKGIRIHTIGVGSSYGEVLRFVDPQTGQMNYVKDKDGNAVMSRLNETILMDIASSAGGVYVRASGVDFGLEYIYDQEIATMQRRKIDSKMERRGLDRYQWPIAIALIFLVLEMLFIGERDKKIKTFLLMIMMFFVPLSVEANVSLLGEKGSDYIKQGNQFFGKQLYQQALQFYDRAQVFNKEDVRIDYNRGTALYKQMKFQEAVEAFQKALLTDDESFLEQVYYNLANARYYQGVQKIVNDTKEAIEILEKSLSDYDKALMFNSENEAAKENRAVVERVLNRLKEQKNSGGGGGGGGGGSSQSQSSDSQNQDSQDQQDQQGQQGQQEQQNQQEQGQENQEERQGEQGSQRQQRQESQQGQQQQGQEQQRQQGQQGQRGQQQGQGQQGQQGQQSQQQQQPQGQQGQQTQSQQGQQAQGQQGQQTQGQQSSSTEKLKQEVDRFLDGFSRNEEPKEMLNFIQPIKRQLDPDKDW